MGTQETKKAGAKIISQKIKLYSLNCKGRKILMRDPRSCHMLFEDLLPIGNVLKTCMSPACITTCRKLETTKMRWPTTLQHLFTIA